MWAARHHKHRHHHDNGAVTNGQESQQPNGGVINYGLTDSENTQITDSTKPT